MPDRKPHPVPITLGRFNNPKNSERHWQQWREEQLQHDRDHDPSVPVIGGIDVGRRLPVRYDDD